MRDAPAEKNGSNYSGTKSTEREKEPKVDYNNSDEALYVLTLIIEQLVVLYTCPY